METAEPLLPKITISKIISLRFSEFKIALNLGLDDAFKLLAFLYIDSSMPKANKKTSLKASLAAHQARAEKAKREADGQKKAYVRNSGGKAKGKKNDNGGLSGPLRKRDTVPYLDGDKILLIGEGQSIDAIFQ